MRYYHRTSVPPDDVVARATAYFGARLTPVEEGPRRRRFAGTLGHIGVTVEAEGGHYTRIVVSTDQPAESEADRLAKRFLGTIHVVAEPAHVLRGAY